MVGELLSPVTRALAVLGQVTWFLLQVLVRLPVPPLFLKEIVLSTALVCRRCLMPIALTLGPFGMVVSLHGAGVFRAFGAEPLLGFLVGISTLRELAPNLTAMLISAQAGAACAAELAAMRAQEEIDATEVMGLDPIKVHVVPRFVGIVLAAPLLTVIGGFVGLMGGYLMATIGMGNNGGAFLDNLYSNLGFQELAHAMLKALVFGALIALISCFLGFTARGTARAVGDAVNHTVVYSITTFLMMNYFLSSALFGIVE